MCIIYIEQVFPLLLSSDAQPTQAKDLQAEIKKAKPDVLSEELIGRKHSLNASLDAAVSEWKGSENKPESWFAKGNFHALLQAM